MKKNNIWFTIIELTVVVAILTIIWIWATKVNFNRLNDRQKLDIFTNKIIVMYEKVRNNALLWKWIWTNLNTPEKWKIEFIKNWSWQVISSYYSWSRIEYEKLDFNNWYEITNIYCKNIIDVNDNLEIFSNGTWAIEINWWLLNTSWACALFNKYRKLETTIKYKNVFQEKIEINTVNWLIQRKK